MSCQSTNLKKNHFVEFLNIIFLTCGQTLEIDLLGHSSQEIEMVTDCEVCCRPMQVTICWPDPGENPVVNVQLASEADVHTSLWHPSQVPDQSVAGLMVKCVISGGAKTRN